MTTKLATDLLTAWHSKARCRYTQYRANQLWRELRLHLTRDEHRILAVAHSHAMMDEGPAELDAEYKKVRDRMLVQIKEERSRLRRP